MANSNNWGEIYNSTWWGDEDWSANSLKIDSAPPGFAGGQNLLKASEDMNITRDWSQFLISVAANSTDEAAPNATDTAEKLTFTDEPQSRIQQQIALEANTTYTFSVYAKVRTGTKAFRLRNVTLKQAQQFTADTSWGINPDDGRYSFTFTTGATARTHTLSIQNAASAGTGEVFFWGAMLNEGATAGDYVKTDASVGGSAPAPDYSGFGDAFGGVTAYYSLRQFTEAETLNAIRVRRSSDDTEQDIGFDANGDLDTTALTTFVNADVDTYTSDFSSGIDGLAEVRVTASSVDGISDGTTSKDDVLKSVLTDGSNTHSVRKNGAFDLSNTHNVSFEYYIPSAQTIDSLVVRTGTGTDGTYTFSVVGSWESETIENWSPSANSSLSFHCAVGGNISAIDADGDVYYLKNIVVTQTTADGAVTTFYDQTGNGNNATNSTSTEQPLVVSGGTLITENGKAAIDFDGVNDYFTLGGTNDAGMLGDISVFSVNKNSISGSSVIVSTGVMQSSYAPNMQWGINGGVGEYIGTTSDGTTRINEAVTTANYGSQVLVSMINDEDGNLQMFADGVGSTGQTAVAPMNDANFALEVGRDSGGQRYYFDGTQQELILYASDQSTNRGTVTTGGGTGIEGNINTYFDIV